MQKIGQPALTVEGALGRVRLRLAQPARWQVEAVQGLAQHRQHTLAAPDTVQKLEVLALGVEGLVVIGEIRKLGDRQVQGPGGQRSAREPQIQR